MAYLFKNCMWSSLNILSEGLALKIYRATSTSFMCWAIWTCRKGRLYFWVPGSWVAGPLAHLSLSPAAPPLTFAYPSDGAALKPTLGTLAGLKQCGCQSPFLTQQHNHCLTPVTVTQPFFLFFSILGVNLPTQGLSSNPLSLQSWNAEALC